MRPISVSACMLTSSSRVRRRLIPPRPVLASASGYGRPARSSGRFRWITVILFIFCSRVACADSCWCALYRFYQTCDADTDCPFSHLQTLASNTDLCWDAFGVAGPQTSNRIDFTNDYYGGNRPAGTRIVFVDGSIDPWHWYDEP